MPLGIGAGVLIVVIAAVAALAGGSHGGPSAGTCFQFDLFAVGMAGDDYLALVDDGWVTEVSCSTPHQGEVMHTFSAAEMDEIGSLSGARRECREEHFERYIGVPYDESRLSIESEWLGLETDDGSDGAVCLVFDDRMLDNEGSRTGSLRNSGR